MAVAVSASRAIPATVIHKPWAGVTIHCFGCPHDFRIKDWGEPKSFEPLAWQAQAAGVKTLWVPQPTEFNAKIERPTRFPQQHRVGDVSVRFGVKADGVELSSAHGLWISPADCPTLVVSDPTTNRLIAGHAGRDCLIDRNQILTGQVTSRPFSIVETILQRLDPETPSIVRAFICCGIGPANFDHRWDHPEYGEENQEVIRYLLEHYGPSVIAGKKENGQINLVALIRRQFVIHGCNPHWVQSDGSDTFTDRDQQRRYQWWSCRRGDQQRNGILVVKK